MNESDEPRPFPWNDATAFALSVLRWPPDTFWRATPRELLAALGPAGERNVEPATSGDLARLMQAFPDAHHPSREGGSSR